MGPDRSKSIVVARNEIDCRSPARFGNDLDLLTQVVYIRNSRFAFEGIIEGAEDAFRLLVAAFDGPGAGNVPDI